MGFGGLMGGPILHRPLMPRMPRPSLGLVMVVLPKGYKTANGDLVPAAIFTVSADPRVALVNAQNYAKDKGLPPVYPSPQDGRPRQDEEDVVVKATPAESGSFVIPIFIEALKKEEQQHEPEHVSGTP